MKHQAIKNNIDGGSNKSVKQKLKDGFAIALIWAATLSLVYIVYVKIKLLIH